MEEMKKKEIPIVLNEKMREMLKKWKENLQALAEKRAAEAEQCVQPE